MLYLHKMNRTIELWYRKIKFLMCVFFTLTSFHVFAQQNLVPNGSFEDYTTISYPPPCFNVPCCSMARVTQWTYTNGHVWWPENPTHVHYFNSVMNYCIDDEYPIPRQGVPFHTWNDSHLTLNEYYHQEAKEENAYILLVTYYHIFYGTWFNNRQNPISKLTDSLMVGHKYCLSFWISVPDCWYFMTSNTIGAYFSTNPPKHNTTQYLNIQPQLENLRTDYPDTTNNWYLVSGSFIADSNYKYITIGNFYPDSLTNVKIDFLPPNHSIDFGLYLDAVALYDCTDHSYQANAGSNRVVCHEEKTTLGTDNNNKRQYTWSPSDGLSDSTAANPIASPLETTTYYLEVIDEFVQRSLDSVTVEVVHCKVSVSNVFTPNNDSYNDYVEIVGEDIAEVHFVIFNRWGVKVFETQNPEDKWDGKFQGKEAAAGVYFYTLEAKFIGGRSASRQGSITLVR